MKSLQILGMIFCLYTMYNTGLCMVDSGIKCDSYELVQYRLTFIGDWSEEKFPKQYPKFRPHAQWSKLIGRIHNNDYNLFSIGKLATSSFKKFAQEAASDDLDKRETQGFNGIFDTFVAPAINAGIGETSADVFVSQTHSKMSAAVRLIPSPDWFVGVNGVEMCVNGSWIYEAMFPLDPIDAGTDRGYTFTSPKWASRPRQPMHQITSKFPNHRANSFYYPELDALPHIAFVKFELLTSNKLHKLHRQVGHQRRVEEESDEIDPEKKREELEEQQILHGEPLLPGNEEDRAGRPLAPQPAPFRKPPTAAAVRLRTHNSGSKHERTPIPRPVHKPTPTPYRPTQRTQDDDDEDADDGIQLTTTTTTHKPHPHPHTTARNVHPRAKDTKALDSNRLAADQSRPDPRQRPNSPRQTASGKPTNTKHKVHHRVHHRKEKVEEKQDCQVGDWGYWSPCSKTCGFGAQKRVRKVIQPPKNGRPCPALQQEKWCGSMRACRDEQKLFSWLQTDNGKGRASE